LAEEFDGWALNLMGVLIELPFWVFRRLKKLKLLERDRETGMRRIRSEVFGLMDLWDGPDFRHDGPLHGLAPGFERAQSPDSGLSGAFLRALGRDCSRLSHPAVERTREYESDLSKPASPTCRSPKPRPIIA